MNENNDYVNYSRPRPAETPPEPPAERTWRDWAAPVLALALSVLYWAVFSLNGILDAGYGPGLGVLAFVLAYYCAVFLMLGPRRDGWGLYFLAVSVCLALCCTLYCHPGFMVLNCFLILTTAAAATFRFSGQSVRAPLSMAMLADTVRLVILALFSRIGQPWKRLRGGSRRQAALAAVSVLASVVLLAVVLALLATADMVFGSFFEGVSDWLDKLSPASALWKIIRAAGLTLFFLSGLYFIRTEPAEPPREKPEEGRPALPFLLPVLLLDVVYVLFCAVQIRYLFGGAEAAAMAGGWAEYARTGFFQLVAVAAINLTLCVLGAEKKRFAAPGGPILRAGEALMLLLTAVILLSAARRMQLYILAFGMSALRLTTLWGMVAAAAGILAAVRKLIKPGFSFCPVFFGIALTSWCVLCLLNPAGLAARYNVNAYLDGRLKTVDVDYLGELTPDAAGALELLERSSDEYDDEIRLVRAHWRNEGSDGWACWKAHLYK